MARTGVSYEEVEKVANQLYQQGITPTVLRVRETLGTGSNTTLARHLKDWHEQYFSEQSSRIPMSIPEELTASVDGFWAAAVAKADENYQEYRASMEYERDVAIAEKDAALLRLTDIEQQNNQLQEALNETQQYLDQRTRELDRLQGKYDELVKKYDTLVQDTADTKIVAQAAIAQAKEVQQKADAQLIEQQQHFETVIDQLKQQLHTEETRYETLENRHLVKVDELQQHLTQANQRVAELDTSLIEQQKYANTQQELNDQQLQQLQAEKEATKQQLQQAQDKMTGLQHALDTALSTNKSSLSQFEKLIELGEKTGVTQTAMLEEITRLETMITTALTSPSASDRDDKP